MPSGSVPALEPVSSASVLCTARDTTRRPGHTVAAAPAGSRPGLLRQVAVFILGILTCLSKEDRGLPCRLRMSL